MQIRRMAHLRPLHLLAALCAAFACTSCGDDSSSNPDDEEPARETVSMDGAVSSVELQAGETTDHVAVLYVPAEFRSVQGAQLDVQATLLNVHLEGVTPGTLAKGVAAQMGFGQSLGAVAYIRVGPNPETVCSDGIVYGPFAATYASSLTVDPPTATADAATLQIINAGSMAVCISITPDFDATLSLDTLAVDVTQENCAAPADFSGRWVGTYQCGNSCSGTPFGGDVDLIVTQDGTSATYTDGGGSGDTYTGTICGNVFRFRRVAPDVDDEVGSLTLDDPTHATKRSTWRTTSGSPCGGHCLDQLTRVAAGLP